jgi:polyisoprenoid-binding protein YceI
MNKAIAMTLGGLLLVTSACDNDPAKGKTQAKVSEAAPDTAAAAAPGASVSYTFSQAGSSIDWVGAKVTAKHEGKFNTFSGKVDVVDGDATKSSATVEIDLASVSSDTEKLTGHLKSPDFFDVAKYPKATFKTTQIKAGGEGGATHTVSRSNQRGVCHQPQRLPDRLPGHGQRSDQRRSAAQAEARRQEELAQAAWRRRPSLSGNDARARTGKSRRARASTSLTRFAPW